MHFGHINGHTGLLGCTGERVGLAPMPILLPSFLLSRSPPPPCLLLRLLLQLVLSPQPHCTLLPCPPSPRALLPPHLPPYLLSKLPLDLDMAVAAAIEESVAASHGAWKGSGVDDDEIHQLIRTRKMPPNVL